MGQLSENSAAPSFVIAATTLFSCITTVRNLTMRQGDSVARSGSEFTLGYENLGVAVLD